MNVPIVEDYADIAKRLAELHPDATPSFRLPVGVVIYPITKARRMTRCRLCFVLDDMKHRLYFAAEASDHKLGSEEGMHFIDYLARHFPSICIMSSFELRLSPEDARLLKEYVVV